MGRYDIPYSMKRPNQSHGPARTCFTEAIPPPSNKSGRDFLNTLADAQGRLESKEPVDLPLLSDRGGQLANA
jgi:hypothetical protein